CALTPSCPGSLVMRTVRAVSVLVLLVLLGCGVQTEVYEPDQSSALTLQIREPAEGDVFDVEVTSTEAMNQRVGPPPTVPRLPQGTKTRLVYTETILAKPAGALRPTKLKREYKQAEVNRFGKPNPMAIANKTVLIEKSGEKYTFTLDKGGVVWFGDAGRVLNDE